MRMIGKDGKDGGGVGGGCCGEWGGWFLDCLRPLAARLPSPWDPLLISPWEGEGNGSRERGHVVVGGGTAVDWGEGV